MSATDLTGRTNGAGDHFKVAGTTYVWVIGETGGLKAQRFDHEEYLATLKAVTKMLDEDAVRAALVAKVVGADG